MTAPLRASHPTLVNVALGERSYEIIIGRGQLTLLGEKIAALRPGARARHRGELPHANSSRQFASSHAKKPASPIKPYLTTSA